MPRRPRLITVLGHTRAGKDTVADMICERYAGACKVAFGDEPKLLCSGVFGVPLAAFYDGRKDQPLPDFPVLQCPRCRALRVVKPSWLPRILGLEYLRCAACGLRTSPHHFGSHWTPRMMVQHVATEGCRFVDQRVWAKLGVRKALGLAAETGAEVAVISDGRFISEAEETVAQHGEVWRLRSDREQRGNGISGHQSQLEVDRVSPRLISYELRNDGTLDDLRLEVDRCLAAPSSTALRPTSTSTP